MTPLAMQNGDAEALGETTNAELESGLFADDEQAIHCAALSCGRR